MTNPITKANLKELKDFEGNSSIFSVVNELLYEAFTNEDDPILIYRKDLLELLRDTYYRITPAVVKEYNWLDCIIPSYTTYGWEVTLCGDPITGTDTDLDDDAYYTFK